MKNIKYTILLTLLILGFSNCKNESATKTETQETPQQNGILVTKKQFENSKMKLGALTKRAFPDIVKTTGMIDVPPQSKAVITSYYAGNVKKSNLLIGDKVRKGQALVTIANPEFVDMQQEYLEVSEQLHFLKTEYERQKTLFKEKISSQKNYLKAKSEYDRTKARYNGLRKKLQMLNINPSSVAQGNITSTITLFSPISGSVTKVNVSKGTYVSPQDIVMEVINTDHIHIELSAFEKDILKIKKEQHITFKIPEASDSIYVAEVHLVGTAIDEETRTVKVHGHLHDEKKHNFAIGMFVEAAIETASVEAFALPEEAVVDQGNQKVVLVLVEQKNNQYTFKTISVKIGKQQDGYIEILYDNIKPSDKILIKGTYDLVDGE